MLGWLWKLKNMAENLKDTSQKLARKNNTNLRKEPKIRLNYNKEIKI